MIVAQNAEARKSGMLECESSLHTTLNETSRSVHQSRTTESATPITLRQLIFTV